MPVRGLASYAAHESRSRGRVHDEPAPEERGEYQRDRDRVIHSAAFRRLEYKTQVFVNHEGDLYRTRLTHSIEVAQIARTIARALQLNEDLSEAIALAHDLGHTPYGHAGQDALNDCMRAYGGFEHNYQSLRVVDELEQKYARFKGLNLSFEAREGILKHCSLPRARALGEVGQRFLDGSQPSLEAQLANLADEIAYNSHDVDDGLRSRLITIDQLCEVELFRIQVEEVHRLHPQLDERTMVHEVVRRLINAQALDLIRTSEACLASAAPESVEQVRAQAQPLIRFSDSMRELNLELKRFLRRNLYQHFRVLRMTSKAGRVVKALFEGFFDNPLLLPPEAQAHVQQLERDAGESGRGRGVADYIAGMTDRFAIAEYERLFDPRQLT